MQAVVAKTIKQIIYMTIINRVAMKKNVIIATLAFVAMPMLAQETYENAKIATEDLNGTARYVGMGGAMEALGADISTISTNPAGIGLFRKSTVSTSFGIVSQQDAQEFAEGNKTNMSFDQIGFVYAARSGQNSYLNFGFNYHKSRNFDYILSAVGQLNSASQNGLSFVKAIGADDENGFTLMNIEETNDGLMGTAYYTSQLDNLYYNNFIIDDHGIPGWNAASEYELNRAHKGYIGEYDFNISGNVNDRIYLGLSVGLHDIHYKAYGEYFENLVNYQDKSVGTMTVCDERRITGTGYDLKIGAIFRPVETSPFRIGLSIATPTWYDLKTENNTRLVNGTDYKGYNNKDYSSNVYEFKLYTPWKLGLSLGHTIGNYLALGASYEYADYAHLDSRYKTGSYYDYWYGDYYDESESDRVMNDHTKSTLKAVSTLKLGLEFKPDPAIAVRFGYNYVSPMYNKEGYKDVGLDSYGTNYSTTTDFTNWKATNRITCGIGYSTGKFNVDLAYQYSASNGSFRPFMDSWGDYNYEDFNEKGESIRMTEQIDNYSDPVNVSNKRHQLMVTLGYKF